MRFNCLCLATLLTIVPVAARPLTAADNSTASWQDLVQNRISEYGHRNWIVIADSAYPVQTSPGIETIVADADHFQVLQTVFDALSKSKHVRPIVYTDRELQFVEDSEAPGISVYQQQLSVFLRDTPPTSLPHEEIISKLDHVSQNFRVLIIKTNMVLPYTSVFLQLDCAYWSSEAERKLRTAMTKHAAKIGKS
ncbi:MAG: RbsD/FucU domain-containing protein [Bryobacteraceae bacterium]